MRSSGTNFLFWFGMICYGTVKIRSLILIARDDVRIPPTSHPPPGFTHYVCAGRHQGPVSVCNLLHSVLCHCCGVCSGILARTQAPVSVSPWRQPGGEHTVFVCVCVTLVCPCVQRKPSPYETATFLSQLTWWWQNGQIWTGWRRPLRHEDLPNLNHVDMSKNAAPRFQKNLDQELKRVG